MIRIDGPISAAQPSAAGRPAQSGQPGAAAARAGAEFEAAFLAEMLKIAGFGRMPESFNGGAGESGFGDFLVREVARDIALTRPLGIGAQVAEAIRKREQS